MAKLFVQLFLCCSIFVVASNGQPDDEPYRPKIHLSVLFGWGNDPNGLTYYNGRYHAFYQYNPYDTIPGPIHWGHVWSEDLINWEYLPIALYPYDGFDIFSGCSVIGCDNSLIAIFSLNKNGSQSQGMASSSDNGQTWTMDSNNPIIPNPNPEKQPDFRDPNIIEYNGVHVMSLAVNDHIAFYESNNDYRTWEWRSNFGVNPNEGDKCGVWECPSIFSLEDEQGNSHDVLFISENGPACGSHQQYLVGQYKDSQFVSYNETEVLFDDGPDNYAAIPFRNDPYGRVILMGWASNWTYAQAIPTKYYRGQYTLPYEVKLITVDGKLRLAHKVVDEFDKLTNETYEARVPFDIIGNQIVDLNQNLHMPFKSSLLKLEYNFDIESVPSGECGFEFVNDLGEKVSFSINFIENLYKLDRCKSGNVSFHEEFANVYPAGRISTSKSYSGYIILDNTLIEIYADEGLNKFTALIFPTEQYKYIKLFCANNNDGKLLTVRKLSVSTLNAPRK